MAPPKSKLDGEEKEKSVVVKITSTRVTRSMNRKTRSQTQGTCSSSKLMKFESPEKRKKKNTSNKSEATKKIKKVEEALMQVEEEEESTEEQVAEQEVEEEEEEKEPEIKKIVIEHCKQCQSFKMRAEQVKKGLKKAIPGVIVTVNADKPRRGCFEIREEDGETFISLLDMKRPFAPMKELDMEQVIVKIIEKIK